MEYSIKNSDSICPKCNYTCNLPSQLKKHFKNNSKCKMTNEEINKYFNDINKEKNCNESNILTCMNCWKVFSRKDALLRHTTKSKCSKTHYIQTLENTGNENQLNQQFINGSNISVINNNNSNNVINNYITNNFIVPTGFEMIPKHLLTEDIKNYLLLGKSGVDKIFKLTFEENSNNNFFFRNSNKNNVSYLTDNYTLEICQTNEIIKILQDKYIQLIYSMYAECANMLQIQEKVKIFDLIQDIEKIKPTDINLDNLIRNLFSKSSNKNGQEIAKRIQTHITTLNTNANYKTIALEYCNKYLDYIKFIDNIRDIECKTKISLRFINSKLGNPLDDINLRNNTIYNYFLLNYFENTYYFKFWKTRIQKETELILHMDNTTVQDIRELNARINSINQAIKLTQHKYNIIYKTVKEEDDIDEYTFFAIIPDIYAEYSYDSDISNISNINVFDFNQLKHS